MQILGNCNGYQLVACEFCDCSATKSKKFHMAEPIATKTGHGLKYMK